MASPRKQRRLDEEAEKKVSNFGFGSLNFDWAEASAQESELYASFAASENEPTPKEESQPIEEVAEEFPLLGAKCPDSGNS
jgi:hypothetical protein